MESLYIGSIVKFTFNHNPKNWLLCDGRILNLTQDEKTQALFGMLSNTFGGDGISTFALPDLREKKPDGSYYQYLEITDKGIPYLNSYICIDGEFSTNN